MKRKILFPAILILCFFSIPLSAQESGEDLPPMPQGPLMLTSVKPEQLHAEYWINRIPDANLLLKTPEQVEIFNKDIRAMIKDQVNIFELPFKRSGGPVRDQMELEYNAVKRRGLLDIDDVPVPPSFFEEKVKPLMQWEKVPEKIKMRWGVAARATSVRSLPTDVKMLEKPGDVEFDMLQFTKIKLWTPVGIFHESSDGNWFYVQAPYRRGWVKAKDVALFPTRDELEKYLTQEKFLVVTGDNIPLYGDPALQQVIQRPSMGAVLPLSGETESAYVIRLPIPGEAGQLGQAYIAKTADVSLGFLPFTKGNIIVQAFKLLGSRYGWGGTYDGRDCSGFIQDVYLPLGVDMPRGSKEQAFVGIQLGHFEYKEDAEAKKAVLEPAIPATTVLRMPTHMMIYLGKVDGQYYVIHSTWAERYSMTSDAKNRINQVVVSDLTLNGESYLGPLFDRIISINEMD